MSAVRFDEVEHRYFVGEVEYPSVTKVLESERLLRIPEILTTSTRADGTLAFARARGTAVHIACELDDRNDLDEETLDPLLLPYLKAWRRFRAETGFACELVEQIVRNDVHQYAGRLDRMGRLSAKWMSLRDASIVLDIKTGQPQRATGYQLAAYQACLPHVELRRKRLGCYLRDDGNYSLVQYDDPADESVFLAALTVYNARRSHR